LVHWLVAARLGTAATGELAACLTVVTVANPFVLGFGNFVGPSVARAFAEGGRLRVREVLFHATLPLAVVALPLAAVAVTAGGWLIAKLYGPDYAGHGTTVALLGLLVPLVAGNNMADHGLRALDRPEVNFRGSLASLLITPAVAW